MSISYKRSLLTITASFIFYFLVSGFSLAQENTSGHILNLREQIIELERQSAEYKKQINQKQKEGTTLKREISILENQISRLKVNILSTGRKIDLASLEINDLGQGISETEGKIKKNRETISELLRRLDGAEKRDLAAILLSNARISDFFGYIERVNNLQAELSANLSAFLDLKNQLTAKKESTKSKKQELEILNRRQENQKTASIETQAAKSGLLTKTKGQEKIFQELLSEVEKKKAEFYEELKKLELEVRTEGLYIVRVKAESIPPKGIKLFKIPLEDYIITQGFGMTAFAKRGAYGGAPHNGIDLRAGPGSEIKSIGQGSVLAKGFNNAAGNWIAIRHDNDLVSVYGHMRDPTLILAGERVNEKTVLGYEGATGFATGSHLHLSLYYEFFSFIGPKTGQIYFNYWQGSLNPLDYISD